MYDDESARIMALRLALSAFETAPCNQVIGELGADRGRLIATMLEMTGLLEESIEEHNRGGAIAWIEDRLSAELDAAGSPHP